MKEDNVIVDKSKAFAIRIIRLYQHLGSEKKEFVLSKQILRSGTSIGANVREAARAQSKADFIAKMQIALKEASETEYWIELLQETDYISEKAGESLIVDCKELLKMITAIIKTAKE
ncbi:MAG: four helix bundle protein [Clostridiales bacterium]|nr:four helix bundle protein [Clostridia bacterium]MCR5567183.1 four helix bundle protein [Clostridiales bacterium]